jgi:plastocyanin
VTSTFRKRNPHSNLKMLLGSLAFAAIAVGVANAEPDSSDTAVTIADFAFGPADVTAPVGSALTWTNAQAGVPHTTTSLDGVWDSGVMSSNAAFTFTFNQPGDFAYQCDIHPSMKGVIHIVAAEAEVAAEPALEIAEPAASIPEPAPSVPESAPNLPEPAPSVPESAPNLPESTPTLVPTLAPTVAPVRVVPTPARAAPTPTPPARYGY